MSRGVREDTFTIISIISVLPLVKTWRLTNVENHKMMEQLNRVAGMQWCKFINFAGYIQYLLAVVLFKKKQVFILLPLLYP